MTTASALTKQEKQEHDTVLDSSAPVPAGTDPDPYSPDERPPRRTAPFKGIADIFFPGKSFKPEDIPSQIARKFKPFLDENLSPENRRQKALDLIEATGEDSNVSGLLKDILSSVKPFILNSNPEQGEAKFVPFLDEITGLESRREKAKELISAIQENDDLSSLFKEILSKDKPFKPDDAADLPLEDKVPEPSSGEPTDAEPTPESPDGRPSHRKPHFTAKPDVIFSEKTFKTDVDPDLPSGESIFEPSSGEPADAEPNHHSPDGRPSHRKPPFEGKPDDFSPEKSFKPDDTDDLLAEGFKPFSNKNTGFKTRRKKALELITALHEKNGRSAFFNPDLALTTEKADPVTNPQFLDAQTEDQDETQSINNLKTELRLALGTYPSFSDLQSETYGLAAMPEAHPLDADII